MQRVKLSVLTTLTYIFFGSLANAATYTTTTTYSDALSQCLTDATTGKDRKDLATWVFVSLSAHPQIKHFASISDAQKQQIDQRMGEIFTRLIAKDCTVQAKQAVVMEGERGLTHAFGILGKLSTQEIMMDTAVEQSLSNFTKYINEDQIEQAFK